MCVEALRGWSGWELAVLYASESCRSCLFLPMGSSALDLSPERVALFPLFLPPLLRLLSPPSESFRGTRASGPGFRGYFFSFLQLPGLHTPRALQGCLGSFSLFSTSGGGWWGCGAQERERRY